MENNTFNNENLSLNEIVNSVKSPKRVNFNFTSGDYMTNEAYKSLRTNLLFCGKDIKTIVITSTLESEGKSTVSTSLAKSLSDIGRKTLLIDADMRKSELLKNGGTANKISGVSELLSGKATSDEVVFKTQFENFDVIFSGEYPNNPVELLTDKRFSDVLAKYREIYDYIIIDSPPLGLVIDAAVIAYNCDGAIMVISNQKVSRKSALEVKRQLEKSGCKILGAVVNETAKAKTKSKYYQSKYYGS